MGVTIFAMTHKKFPTPKDPVYMPLQVGRAGKADLGYIGDDTGVSISDKNCFYGELTGVYWVWKNIKTSDYVGICHYRRYFCHEDGRILTESEYEKILSEYDMITSKKLKLNYSYYDGYAGDYNIKDLQAVGEVIMEYEPEYYEAFRRLVHGKGTYFGNMMVCAKPLYDAYCEWLFGIFEKAESRIDASGYDDYHKRVYGFISEFLLMVWAEVKGLRVYECKVGMTDEKRETAEIKEKLAEYFARKDIDGAKAYILACLEKRPDVLMEASDIMGELKLAMQVIAVCGLEQQTYGSSTIDSIWDFQELLRYFRGINDLLMGVKTGSLPVSTVPLSEASADTETVSPGKDWCDLIQKAPITNVALEASARLFYSAEEAEAAASAVRQALSKLTLGSSAYPSVAPK